MPQPEPTRSPPWKHYFAVPDGVSNQPQRTSLWPHRPSTYCHLCRRLVTYDLKNHPKACSLTQRLQTWRKITSLSLSSNPHQTLYIYARDYLRSSLHALDSLLANGDFALLDAALVFIEKWRYQERLYGNNHYDTIVLSVDTRRDALLQAVAEQILSVLSWFGRSLVVILAIEDTFWALSRKVDFSVEENVWLLQWLAFAPEELNWMMLHIKEMFLQKFLPVGRPRKSQRVLRQKLNEMWDACKGYDYSTAAWTWELDSNLVRVARVFGSEEERVYAFVAWCLTNDKRLRSSKDILTRLKVLGCEGLERIKSGDEHVWEAVRARPGSVEVFKSGRRRSV